MSDPTKELFNDVIAERDSAWEDDLLAGTLGAVRRQRRQRNVMHSSLAGIALLTLFVCWLDTSPHSDVATSPVTLPVSKPAPNYTVETRALAPSEFVATSTGLVETIRTAPAMSIVVNTQPSHELYQLIDDAELRMLLANRNPVILRQPDRPPRLLLEGKFVGPAIQFN